MIQTHVVPLPTLKEARKTDSGMSIAPACAPYDQLQISSVTGAPANMIYVHMSVHISRAPTVHSMFTTLSPADAPLPCGWRRRRGGQKTARACQCSSQVCTRTCPSLQIFRPRTCYVHQAMDRTVTLLSHPATRPLITQSTTLCTQVSAWETRNLMRAIVNTH